MTNRAIDFIEEAGEQPWCLHLSYIKPHWPYIVSAPYDKMFGPGDVVAPNRSEAERRNPHPVYSVYLEYPESRSFSDDAIRDTVVPTYMGLVKQLDDHLGRLFDFLDRKGLTENTMIVFTSDHGDYLGDHWLGEKELFHDESAKVPLIIVDPSAQANSTRGTACADLVQAIDLAPTFVEFAGGQVAYHILEGQSLLPNLRGERIGRPVVISELDYGHRAAGMLLDRQPSACRAWMVRTKYWKYVYYQGYPAQLFDMVDDPRELTNLAASPSYADIEAQHRDLLFDWFRSLRSRITVTDKYIIQRRQAGFKGVGVIIGEW